jgi:hypothetical protein
LPTAGRSSEELSSESESESSESSLADATGFFAAAGGFTAGADCDLVPADFAPADCDDALDLEVLGLAAKAFCFDFASFLDFVIVCAGFESSSLSESTMRSWLSAAEAFFATSAALAMLAIDPLESLWCEIGQLVPFKRTSMAHGFQDSKKVRSSAKLFSSQGQIWYDGGQSISLPPKLLYTVHQFVCLSSQPLTKSRSSLIKRHLNNTRRLGKQECMLNTCADGAP